MKPDPERNPPRCARCGSENLRLIVRYCEPHTGRVVRLFKCPCGEDVRDA